MIVDIGAVNSILEEGENIEWVGKAEPFNLIDSANKKSLLTSWVTCAAISASLTAAYILVALRNSLDINMIIFVFVIGFPLFVAIRPFLDKMALKKLTFVLTDKRAIIHKGGSQCTSMELGKIDDAAMINKNNGIGDVVFGSPAVKLPVHKLRHLTLMPLHAEDEKKSVTGMVFYNVAEAGKIMGMFKKNTSGAE